MNSWNRDIMIFFNNFPLNVDLVMKSLRRAYHCRNMTNDFLRKVSCHLKPDILPCSRLSAMLQTLWLGATLMINWHPRWRHWTVLIRTNYSCNFFFMFLEMAWLLACHCKAQSIDGPVRARSQVCLEIAEWVACVKLSIWASLLSALILLGLFEKLFLPSWLPLTSPRLT